jgi:DNA-binding transcriptional ArsR family regulator
MTTKSEMLKILKDETRRKILVFVSEKGEVTYSDLMEQTEISSPEVMNYHLKVLADLLSKNDEDKFTLTEKGKVASNFILTVPKELPKETNKREKMHRTLLTVVPIVVLII